MGISSDVTVRIVVTVSAVMWTMLTMVIVLMRVFCAVSHLDEDRC